MNDVNVRQYAETLSRRSGLSISRTFIFLFSAMWIRKVKSGGSPWRGSPRLERCKPVIDAVCCELIELEWAIAVRLHNSQPAMMMCSKWNDGKGCYGMALYGMLWYDMWYDFRIWLDYTEHVHNVIRSCISSIEMYNISVFILIIECHELCVCVCCIWVMCV